MKALQGHPQSANPVLALAGRLARAMTMCQLAPLNCPITLPSDNLKHCHFYFLPST